MHYISPYSSLHYISDGPFSKSAIADILAEFFFFPVTTLTDQNALFIKQVLMLVYISLENFKILWST